jgi:hypothetical protein
MFLNVAFYYGFQWTLYNLATGELSEVQNVAGSIRLTSNQIQPRIRNLFAKMTKNKPIEEIVAKNWTEKALFSSSVSRGLLEQFRDIHNEAEVDAETIMWLLLCGDCFRKIGFDPTTGDINYFEQKIEEIAPDMDATQLEGAGLFNAGDRGAYFVGDVFDEVVPPFEVFAPEYARANYAPEELMHVKLMPLQHVKDKWGRRASKITPTSTSRIDISNKFQQRLLGMANPDVGTSIALAKALNEASAELVYVYELWKKPSRRYPTGRLTIAAGPGQEGVLFDAANPYYEAMNKVRPLRDMGGIPLIKFAAIEAPGRYWNISPVEAMRPLQVEYNKTITDMVQNRATVGRNKILAPKTASIDKYEVANIHGQILEYTGIKEPKIFPAVPLPVQVERETERNRQDLDTTSGSHEVSRAQVPTGVKSGIAINYLLEQDDTTLGPIIQNYERAKRRVAMLKLAFAKEFYDEVRILENSNVDSLIEVLEFTGSDIETNVRVVPGSAMPQSKAALQAIYLDLYDRGALVDNNGQPDPEQLFALLKNVMPIERLAEESTLDRARARKENLLLSKGMQILPQHWEDHWIHIGEHNKFRKSERFYNASPMVKYSFDMHVQFHIDMLAPPVESPVTGMLQAEQAGQESGNKRETARKSPSFAGQGSMGALNNPPSNRGGTIAGGR